MYIINQTYIELLHSVGVQLKRNCVIIYKPFIPKLTTVVTGHNIAPDILCRTRPRSKDVLPNKMLLLFD